MLAGLGGSSHKPELITRTDQRAAIEETAALEVNSYDTFLFFMCVVDRAMVRTENPFGRLGPYRSQEPPLDSGDLRITVENFGGEYADSS